MACLQIHARLTSRAIVSLVACLVLATFGSGATAPAFGASKRAKPHFIIKHHGNLTETYLPDYPLPRTPPRNTPTAPHIRSLYLALKKSLKRSKWGSKTASYFALIKAKTTVIEGVAVPMGKTQVQEPNGSRPADMYTLATWGGSRPLIQAVVWHENGISPEWGWALMSFNTVTHIPSWDKPLIGYDSILSVITFAGNHATRLAVRGNAPDQQFFSRYLRGVLTLTAYHPPKPTPVTPPVAAQQAANDWKTGKIQPNPALLIHESLGAPVQPDGLDRPVSTDRKTISQALITVQYITSTILKAHDGRDHLIMLVGIKLPPNASIPGIDGDQFYLPVNAGTMDDAVINAVWLHKGLYGSTEGKSVGLPTSQLPSIFKYVQQGASFIIHVVTDNQALTDPKTVPGLTPGEIEDANKVQDIFRAQIPEAKALLGMLWPFSSWASMNVDFQVPPNLGVPVSVNAPLSTIDPDKIVYSRFFYLFNMPDGS